MSGLHAILLAAGAALRFGGGKLLAELEGVPLIQHALRAAGAAPVDSVLLVVGCGGDAVWAAAGDMALRVPVRRVEAPDWAQGLSASLRAGVAALPADAAGAFVFLGDMPSVDRAALAALAGAVMGGAVAAVPVCGGEMGHPVVLGPRMLRATATLRGDRGARALLQDLGDALVRVDAGPGALRDVDLADDLRVGAGLAR